MQSLLPLQPFYFLRHGETDWNAEQRIQGRTDIPLNPQGLAQAQAAAEVLRPLTIHRIICSPLKRAAATAAVVQQTLGKPLLHDEGLIEQHYGSFEGRLRSDIATECGLKAFHNFWEFLPPDAEPRHQLLARATASVALHLKAYPTETLLFVGHGGFLGALVHQLGLNGHQRFANALPYFFNPTAQGWEMTPLTTPIAA